MSVYIDVVSAVKVQAFGANWRSLNKSFSAKRVLEIGLLGPGDGHQLFDDPFAETMPNAADIRTDRSCWTTPFFLALVNLRQNIKLTKRALKGFRHMFADVLLGHLQEDLAIVIKPIFNLFLKIFNCFGCLILRDRFIDHTICEMHETISNALIVCH